MTPAESIPQYVLDTYALMSFFRRESGRDTVRQVLAEHVQGKVNVFMTEINWGEFYYMMAKKSSLQEAEVRLRQVARLGIIIEPINRELVKAAADLKIRFSTSKSRLSYADCFAAALTIQKNAILLTGDPEFSSLTNDITIRWLRNP